MKKQNKIIVGLIILVILLGGILIYKEIIKPKREDIKNHYLGVGANYGINGTLLQIYYDVTTNGFSTFSTLNNKTIICGYLQ